jgi:peptide/nickel transport system permease protein
VFAFIVRRIIAGLSVIVAVSILTFILFYVGPTDPARAICGDRNCVPERLHAIQQSLHLNDPIPVQMAEFYKGVFVGRDIQSGGIVKRCTAPCFGWSFINDQPVTQLMVARMAVTVSVALGAAVIFVTIGCSFGVIASIRRGTGLDRGLMASTLVVTAFPYYLIALLAYLTFTLQLPIFPTPGYTPITQNPVRWFAGMLLPWVVLGVTNATAYARYTRTAMVETISEDFVRTARAKGLTMQRVYLKHALRAALTSVVTILGLDLAGLLTGTIFTERIFNVQGLGLLGLQSFQLGDLPVIMGVVIFSAILLVAFNLVVDIIYSVLDPRVRLGAGV